jgi:hypothetical protein
MDSMLQNLVVRHTSWVEEAKWATNKEVMAPNYYLVWHWRCWIHSIYNKQTKTYPEFQTPWVRKIKLLGCNMGIWEVWSLDMSRLVRTYIPIFLPINTPYQGIIGIYHTNVGVNHRRSILYHSKIGTDCDFIFFLSFKSKCS